MTFNLPVIYHNHTQSERRLIRLQYIEEQNNLCMFCKCSLSSEPHSDVADKQVNWKLFPPSFLAHPIHLQHDHKTGLTEGAVHAYCNAVMWQYHGK